MALSVEIDSRLAEATATNLPNIVHAKKVEEVNGGIFKQVLARRKISAILVGGGPPCQGNSALNPNRKGAADPRTQEASHLGRIARELEDIAAGVPILKLLENVAGAPQGSRDLYTEVVGGPPVEINARIWGWVNRNRAFWLAGPDDHLDSVRAQLPPGFALEGEGKQATVTW